MGAGELTELEKALRVLVLTPHIAEYLAAFDPKALEQATAALGLPPLSGEKDAGQDHWELEQRMGDGSWKTVWQTKEQADYETPGHLSFPTEFEARRYADHNWGEGSRHVRLVHVRSIRSIKEG
jgi:hypothetical protein